MVLIVSPQDVDQIKSLLKEKKEIVYEIGKVIPFKSKPVEMLNVSAWEIK